MIDVRRDRGSAIVRGGGGLGREPVERREKALIALVEHVRARTWIGRAMNELAKDRRQNPGERVRAHRCAARGRRTARTFPVFPPPQKNRSLPSDSSPETFTPAGISIDSRTLPFCGSMRRISLSSPS